MSETARALRHLARSREVRALVLRKAGRFCIGMLCAAGLAMAIRWWLEKPITEEFVADLIIGIATIGLMLLVSAVRTVRAVLREHGCLR